MPHERSKSPVVSALLTEADLDRLSEILKSSKSRRAMNLEELDGFFAALIAGPEVVLPSEYLPEVFGGEMSETCFFDTLGQAGEALGLIVRHWNSIAATLNKGDVHLPLLLEDVTGAFLGNDWSRGFMRGTRMRHQAWAELISDDKCGWIIPVLMLYYEHDPDPELRPGPIGPEKREEIIVQMAAGVVKAYRHFRSDRRREPVIPLVRSIRHYSQAIGRNDPCPCGSGNKYKRCCGKPLVH